MNGLDKLKFVDSLRCRMPSAADNSRRELESDHLKFLRKRRCIGTDNDNFVIRAFLTQLSFFPKLRDKVLLVDNCATFFKEITRPRYAQFPCESNFAIKSQVATWPKYVHR